MDNLKSLVRQNILELKPYSSARGSHLDGLLLDANENSLGSVVDNEIELNRYPDPHQTKLRTALGKHLSVEPSHIFCGVGSDEIIDLLVRIFCEPGKDEVIIFEPTYGMYKVVCDINNAKTNSFPLTKDFQINLTDWERLPKERSKIAFICSPNNPTANLLRKEDIITISKSFSGIVVVDQAYIDFADERELVDEFETIENIVLIRTFSKAWGLAGVRFGYSISNPFIVKLLMKVKAPYTINKLTESVILSALSNPVRKYQFVESIKSERNRMENELQKIKVVEKVYNSAANFIMFKVEDADYIYNSLAENNIIIRNRSSQPGLNGCLRVTVGTTEENNKFLNELRKIS